MIVPQPAVLLMPIIDHERADRWEWIDLYCGSKRLHSLFHCPSNGNTLTREKSGQHSRPAKARVLSNSLISTPAFSWVCILPL